MFKRSFIQLPAKIRSFSIDVFYLVGGQALIAVIALFSSALIARQLGVEDRGFLAIATLLPNTLIAFSDFGIGWAGIKFIASKKWPAATVFMSNVAFMAVRMAVITGTGLLLVYYYSDSLFPGVPQQYLYLGLLQIFSLAIQGMMLPLLLAFDKARLYSTVLLASQLVSVFVLVVTWQLVGLSVVSILIPQAAAATVVSIYIIWKLMLLVGENSKPSLGYLKEAFRFGFGIYFSYVCHFTSEKLVLLILNFFGGAIYVSLHTIAQSLTERIYLITDAVGTVLFPNISAESSNSNFMTPMVFKVTGIVIALIATTLMLVADVAVNIIYSSEYSDAADIMRLLLVSTVLASMWNILSNDINARGYTNEIALVNLLLTIVTLSVTLAVTPVHGMIGAAIGAVAGYSVALIVGVVLFLSKTDQITAREMFLFSVREREALLSGVSRFFNRHG